MIHNKVVLINNEKISSENDGFYCDNDDVKSIPEGLSNYNEIFYIGRKLKKKGIVKIHLKNPEISSNIFTYLFSIIKTLNKPQLSYLLVSISPYTFASFLILFLFKKKIFVYLRSSGHDEYKYILGNWAVFIYDFMYKMVTSKSKVIVVNPKLHNKKENSFLALPSKLDNDWLTNHKEAKVNINEVKILYVGRINPEKGILEFLKIFEEAKLNAKITLVATKGDKKMETENIKILHNLDKKSLIDTYDNHTITILPSYTEGHPQVVDESLARRRPVIIFDDISYIIKDNHYL